MNWHEDNNKISGIPTARYRSTSAFSQDLLDFFPQKLGHDLVEVSRESKPTGD